LILQFAFFHCRETISNPPTASPSICRNINGIDLGPIISQQVVYLWDPKWVGSVIFSICDTLQNYPCPGSQLCSNISSNCCGMCQTWMEPDPDAPTAGVSLGLFSSASSPRPGAVELIYRGGDIVPGTDQPIGGIIRLTCGNTSLRPIKFTEPSMFPPYNYILEATTNILCPDCRKSPSCYSCLNSDSNCTWCLDGNICTNATCQNRIKNKDLCPQASYCNKFKTCTSCLSLGTYPCGWCYDNGGNCLDPATKCESFITNFSYCGSQKFKIPVRSN